MRPAARRVVCMASISAVSITCNDTLDLARTETHHVNDVKERVGGSGFVLACLTPPSTRQRYDQYIHNGMCIKIDKARATHIAHAALLQSYTIHIIRSNRSQLSHRWCVECVSPARLLVAYGVAFRRTPSLVLPCLSCRRTMSHSCGSVRCMHHTPAPLSRVLAWCGSLYMPSTCVRCFSAVITSSG